MAVAHLVFLAAQEGHSGNRSNVQKKNGCVPGVAFCGCTIPCVEAVSVNMAIFSYLLWRMVMSRGQDERTHMQSMSSLISTREGLSNRELIDDGAAWVLQGNE